MDGGAQRLEGCALVKPTASLRSLVAIHGRLAGGAGQPSLDGSLWLWLGLFRVAANNLRSRCSELHQRCCSGLCSTGTLMEKR